MDTSASPASHDTLEHFLKRVLAMQAAWVVAGEEGLARVASPTHGARMATLLWSRRSEAERRGAQIVAHPRIKPLSLAELYTDVLPKLAELDRLVGLEWTAQPTLSEIEPGELMRCLRSDAVALFLRKATGNGSVWILQGTQGPAFLMSRQNAGAQMLPCWHDRASAQARIAGPLAEMVAAEVPLADFRAKTLPWIAESRRLVAPAYCEGKGLLEFEAADLEARFDQAFAPDTGVVERVA